MSWLKVIIQTETTSGELELESSTDENRQSIIDGFMSVFGANLTPKQDNLTHSPTKEANQTVHEKEVVVPLKSVAALNINPGGLLKPPLIGSGRTLETPISELLSSKPVKVEQSVDKEPNYYKTGIKYKEGIPHYRCHYWCKNPDCKNKGNHYILEAERKVACHICGEELKVRPATDGKLQKDGWGNFFIADELVRFN